MRALLLALLLGGAASAAADGGNSAVLDVVWREARAAIHPPELADRYFTPAARARLEAAAQAAPDLYAFAPALDRFLRGTKRSHTGFYHDRSIDFYLYRSMFTTRDLDRPPVWHIGVQYRQDGGRWIVREVWDGSPAEHAGLRRGDVLVSAGGEPYDPYLAFNPGGAPVTVALERAGQRRRVQIQPVPENPNRSLLEALRRSVRVIEQGGHRIGYLHLWAGTHPRMLEVYLESLERLRDTDALILDLRGGFGGAWYEFLDPFFTSRDGFFSYTVLGRTGSETFTPGERPAVLHYDRPLVALINEGTRSGKEALAWQLRENGRAVLVGERTRGAFTAGRGVFTDPALPYFLFIANAEYRLNGETIEGVGVAPDVVVPFPGDGSGRDPQLERALTMARSALPGQPGPSIRRGSTIRSNSSASR